jgi:hypothetical protein
MLATSNEAQPQKAVGGIIGAIAAYSTKDQTFVSEAPSLA